MREWRMTRTNGWEKEWRDFKLVYTRWRHRFAWWRVYTIDGGWVWWHHYYVFEERFIEYDWVERYVVAEARHYYISPFGREILG